MSWIKQQINEQSNIGVGITSSSFIQLNNFTWSNGCKVIFYANKFYVGDKQVTSETKIVNIVNNEEPHFLRVPMDNRNGRCTAGIRKITKQRYMHYVGIITVYACH